MRRCSHFSRVVRAGRELSPLWLASAASALSLAGCWAPEERAGEGEPCSQRVRCEEQLACVPGVGEEHGLPSAEAVCEAPQTVYGFLHYGERGENRRVDEALEMLDGVWRLPRMGEADPSLSTVPHAMVDRDGAVVRCRGLAGDEPEHDCEVPDFRAYYAEQVPPYDRFILFGLRMAGALTYVEQHAPPERLRDRYRERTGRRLSRAAMARLRVEARHTALALFDSFVERGHRPYALAEIPECATSTGGYQNPNRSWAPELAQWDPGVTIGARGRLVVSGDAPSDCSGEVPESFRQLRDSLWDHHATAYRALNLANAYQQFRGVLPPARQEAWLRAIRETGDALALPSSYEPGDNHGITESAALIQLGRDFAGVDLDVMPESVTAAWLDLGRHRLNDLFIDTIFPDGVQVEQSPFYHNYQLGLLLLVTRWLEQSGIDLTSGIDPRYTGERDAIPPEQRRDFDTSGALLDPDVNGLDPSSALEPRPLLDRMVRASIHLTLPDGWIPLIGSSLPQQFRGYNAAAFSSYVEQSTPLARQLRLQWAPDEGGEPWPDAEDLVVFEDSGFVVMHGGPRPGGPPSGSAEQTHLVFNTGAPYHGHSHADAFSLHLYGPDADAPGAGWPLLVDSGWFSYDAEGRHYFESTRAHNTVAVDGRNQCSRDPSDKREAPDVDRPLSSCAELAEAERALESQALDKPPLGSPPVAGQALGEEGLAIPASDAAEAARVNPGEAVRGLTLRGDAGGQPWSYQSAAHRLYAGVTHRRAVLLVGGSLALVVDALDGAEPHDFAQAWHLTPEVGLEAAPALDGSTLHFRFARQASGAKTQLSLHTWNGGEPIAVALPRGDPGSGGVPGPGWYSTADSQREPTQVVELHRAGQSEAVFASVFLLGPLAGRSAEVAVRAGADASERRIEVALDDGALVTASVRALAAGVAGSEGLEVQLTGALP